MGNQRGFIQIFIGIFALLAGAGLLIAKYHDYHPMKVAGISMQPTYVEGQNWVMKNYKSSTPKRGDVVTFLSPTDSQYKYFARIVGLSGESMMVKENRVYINGKVLDESYLSKDTITEPGNVFPEGEEIKIPDGEYAMLADSRSYSQDSRDYGFVSRDNIVGKVVFCYYNCDLKAELPPKITTESNKRTEAVDQNTPPSQKVTTNPNYYQEQRPHLDADAMFNLINQYRQSKSKPVFTKSNELCVLAQKRANYLMINNQAATKVSAEEYQSTLSDHVYNYSGVVGVGETYIVDAWDNAEALEVWKKSPKHNEMLLETIYQGQPITHACVAVINERANSIVVLNTGDK